MEGIIDENGAFTENWQDQVFPGDENKEIRSNPTLANLKDIGTMARQVISGESQIGKLTGGRAYAILPNEHSSPEEIEAFHTKMGRPKTPQEYGFDQLKDANPKFVEKMSAALHAGGASKTLAESLGKAYMEFQAEHDQAIETDGKIADAKADKAIRQELATAYDQHIKDANLAISAIAAPIDAEFAKQLAEEMPYNGSALKFLAKVGQMISEDGGLTHSTGPAGGAMTKNDALDKIKEIQESNPYWATPEPVGKPRSVEKHEEALKQVTELFNIAYGG